jgi:hypothetical protein
VVAYWLLAFTVVWTLVVAAQVAYGVTWPRQFEAVQKAAEPRRFLLYIALQLPLLVILIVLTISELLV